MSDLALTAEDVTVRYGKRMAVDGVSLSVPIGSVYALLGRNGAGKSSLIRVLLGLLRPDQGQATLLGEDVWRNRARLMERTGVVAEEADAPPEMRLRDLGWMSSRLYARWQQGAFDERLTRFDIDSAARFGELSKGQKKQVALALALAATPELILLDDPTLGLDVVARKSLFEEVIADMADRGLTVFIATHDLGAIESIADRVGILKNGRLVLDEELETLKNRFRRIRFAGPADTLAEANLTVTWSRPWGSGTEAVATNYDDLALDRLRQRARTAEVVPMSLEEIFMAVVGEERS
ncbi:MAG: ABC transporter ATP-binding protein [Acidobacteriota bacterium]